VTLIATGGSVTVSSAITVNVAAPAFTQSGSSFDDVPIEHDLKWRDTDAVLRDHLALLTIESGEGFWCRPGSVLFSPWVFGLSTSKSGI
jgi:hypothetical protein